MRLLESSRAKHWPSTSSDLGYEVKDHGDVDIVRLPYPDEPGNPKHLAEMLASCENIIVALARHADHEFPVILGGDHSIAIAHILGRRKASPRCG